MKLRLKLRFLVSTLAALALSLAALPALAAPNTAVVRGIGSTPATLVAAIARTQAQEAAKNPAYAIDHNGCAQLGERNTAPVLAGCFGKSGPAFSTGKQTLRLRLSAWGRAGALRPVTLMRSAPEANRIEYRGRHIAEWWRVLPLGYEQGFTIKQAPAGHGNVVLQLSASTAPAVAHGTLAWGRLRYGKLQVTDAAGHVLPATLSAQGKTITLAFDAAHARYPVTIDPLVWVQQQEVTDAPGAVSDQFGYSVALSGDGTTALVGADNKTIGGLSQQGAAYVYTLANGTWSQVAELTASDGASGDLFGFSVALSANGTIALVGAMHKNVNSNWQGVAYVYTMPGNGWATTSTYTTELTASGGATADYFGYSVALSANGTIALVGASYTTVNGNSGQGAAYVLTTTDNWSTNTQAELTASDGGPGDHFGWSVALSGDGTTALVGAESKNVNGNSGQGAAYVYLSGGNWVTTSTYDAELTASDGAAADYFGGSVALSGDGATELVGAWNKTVGNTAGQGAAYVYRSWVTTATYTAELTASDGAANDHFGKSVAFSGAGTTALVGTYVRGTAYVYAMPGNGGWVTTSNYTAELTASDGVYGDNFGGSVALSSAGTTALVGADKINYAQGAAYFFTGSDLSAVLSAPTTVQINTPFSSQYTLTNTDTTASEALVVNLPVPATNAGYGSVSASQGTCSYNSTTKVATCALGSIPGNGGTASATLNLQATGALSSTIAQSGQLTNGSPNLTQTASTTIVPPPPPTASGLNNVTVTAPTTGTESFAIAGTGTLTVTATSSNTTLLPNADITGASACTATGSCTLTLTPVGGQTGSTAVTVIVTDAYSQSAAGAFTFTVQPPPTAPTANNLSLTTYENSAISTNLSAGAPNGDALSYAVVAQPAHGKVTVNASTSAFTYTPASGYSGSDSFTFRAKDTVTGLSSKTATVSITVKAIPPPGQVSPVASDLTLTTYSGQALRGTLPAVVTPSSDTLSYAIAAQPAHGKVTVNASTGAFTYTPASGYSGSDSFTFRAKDTVTGLSSKTATVSITVKATPPSPAAGGGSGGGGFGGFALLALLLLALVPWRLRHRSLHSHSTL